MSKRVIILWLSIGIFLVFTLFPIAWTFVTSISPLSELMAMPKHWIPSNPTFQNYYAIFTGKPVPGFFASTAPANFMQGLKNSLILTLSCVTIAFFLIVFAGFAFSVLQFPFKRYFFLGIFSVVLLPHLVVLPALRDIFRSLGLLDTIPALILFDLSWSVPFSLWLMSSYFSTIPTELIKAARIDGCSWINVLFKVILPNSIPGIVAVLIIEFIEVWNEFIGALVLTETMASKTLPVVLAEFTSLTGVDYGGLAAGAIITSIPAFVFALIFQKYIVRGLTAGAVKG